MAEVRTLSESDGVRTVTNGKETWKEYLGPKRGVIKWIEQEVLFHPNTWYTKALGFFLGWFVLVPLMAPVYQVAALYFMSPWVGLDGWAWWQTAIKLLVLAVIWIPLAIILYVWVSQNSTGENGIDADD